MNKNVLFVSIFTSFLSQQAYSLRTPDLTDIAMRIAHETIIIDGHIDVPYRLSENWEDVTQSTENGQFDYPRAKKGGLNAPFMSIYTPAKYDGTPNATHHANTMINYVENIVNTAPKKFMIPKSVSDVEAAFKNGKIALPLGMENGSPLNGDLKLLEHFYSRGVRYITLSHSKSNEIADSSYDTHHQYGEVGISNFGIKVINRMNELGIIIDISHVSDTAFYTALKTSKAPIFVSHSSARKFVPGFERNMSDDMIKKLAEHGGVIMINFGSMFLTEEANLFDFAEFEAYQQYLKTTKEEDNAERRESFFRKWEGRTPYPYASLSDVLDHIDHIKALTGNANHIGIGSDFDGVGNTLPIGLKDVSCYPNLIKGLLERGYSEKEIKKILSENALRVWREVEKVAKNKIQ